MLRRQAGGLPIQACRYGRHRMTCVAVAQDGARDVTARAAAGEVLPREVHSNGLPSSNGDGEHVLVRKHLCEAHYAL